MSTKQLFGVDNSAVVGKATLSVSFERTITLTWGMLLTMLGGADDDDESPPTKSEDATPQTPTPTGGGNTPATPRKGPCACCKSTRKHYKWCTVKGGPGHPPVEVTPVAPVAPVTPEKWGPVVSSDALLELAANSRKNKEDYLAVLRKLLVGRGVRVHKYTSVKHGPKTYETKTPPYMEGVVSEVDVFSSLKGTANATPEKELGILVELPSEQDRKDRKPSDTRSYALVGLVASWKE